MAILKCKMCGGQLSFEEGSTVCECEYCGSKQTIPAVDDEKKITLYERANRLRFNSEFDKAAGVYENIVSEFPEEAEAYWGLVLCRYGIEYVDDPATGKKVPTCHRSSFDSVMDDSDFEMVMENADSIARSVYREQAKQIEEIRKGIVEISGKEEPYDIFICYKETSEDGQRTIDSVLAQDVYDALTAKGYRVFFSRITLEDKLGTEYEPYIFAALNSAKVMLAFGTSYDYYNAVWVKNEWSRYLKLMAKDKEKHLIPCYKDIDAYDIPKEFAKLQAQDMGKVGAVQDLLRGIDKLIGKNTPDTISTQQTVVVQQNGSPNVNALLQRGFNALEDDDWDAARGFFNRVLDSDATCAEGYMGLFMADIAASNKAQLEVEFKNTYPGYFDENKNYQRAKKNADDVLMSEIVAWEQLSLEEEEKRIIAKKEAIEAAEKKNAEIVAFIKEYKKIDTIALQLSEEDQLIISNLKTEVEKAQDECDKSHSEYSNSNLHMEKENLKTEIAKKEKYIASLGLFKGAEKAAAKEQICVLKEKIRLIDEEIANLSYVIREKESTLDTAKNALVNSENTIRQCRKKFIVEKLVLNGLPIFKDVQPGDTVDFGLYEQNSGIEPITWIVLDVQGSRRLLISKYAIERVPYNNVDKNVTWNYCTLREFLNGKFIYKAFSEIEQQLIESVELTNDENRYSRIDGGSNTIDKIFCLSISEAEKYFTSNKSSICKATKYAKTLGAFTGFGGGDSCSWWLRSPGGARNEAATVNRDGVISSFKHCVTIDAIAVRPALWINLE